MIEKKSIMLYCDSLEILEDLTDEQAGKLFKEIHKYHEYLKENETQKTQSVSVGLDGLLGALFKTFRNYIDRDFEAYLNKVEANRKNGKKGGRPSNKKTAEKTQDNPQKADKDKDKDKDISSPNFKKPDKPVSEFDLRVSKYLYNHLKKICKIKEPNFNKWANNVRLMREVDKRTEEQIKSMIELVFVDNEHFDGTFWRANIKSTDKLRQQYDAIALQISTRRKTA